MEGTPFAVENKADDDEEEKRKSRAKKPENLGILAVESPEEEKLSPLEKVIAALREPAPKAEKKPDVDVEEEPVVLPETEPPAERVPEEDARKIVHEMVRAEQQTEAKQEEAPEPKIEEIPEPTVEAKPIEVPEAEPPKPEPKPETVKAEKPEPEPVVQPEVKPVEVVAEKPPAPDSEIAPEPKIEKPEPVEPAAEKPETPPDDDDDKKKPGFIRSLFRRRERDKPEKATEKTVEKKPEAPAPIVEKEKPEEPEFKFNEQTEAPVEKPKVEKVPEAPEAPRKPEAKPERIGQMLMHAEDVAVEQPAQPVEAAVSSKEAEKKLQVEASPIEPASGKRIDTLSRAELMELGETIEINGSNLRHIYETHLIGERGLRRLVAEHIRGGNLPEALRREVMEHEMDFERDPVMRDLALTAATPIESNHTGLDKLLQEADVTMSNHGEQTAFSKASAKYERAGARQKQSRQYRILDIALITIISILTLLVILVLLMRG